VVVEHTGRPKYVEVAASLRSAIAAGTYPVGSELPSTARLTESFGVSTTVVRAAIRELRTEGLIIGQPGKAVFVRAEPPAHDQNGSVEDQLAALSAFVRTELTGLAERITALENGR
jgi:GntR family transcriptional regulator